MREMMSLRIAMMSLVAASLVLSGCSKEEDDRGVSRVPTVPVTGASVPPVEGNHPAPPLSQMAGSAGTEGDAAAMAHAHAGMTPADVANTTIEAGDTKVMAGGNILQVAGLAFTVSEDWKNVKPASNLRAAQYELPGVAGAAELVVFYFGRNQGGGTEDNIRRWAGQFSVEGETEPPAVQVARIEKENLRIAMVKTEGTYDPGSMGPMMPNPGPQPNSALFGLVIEGGPEGSLFIKVTGPKATITEQNEALEAFAQSVRVSNYQ